MRVITHDANIMPQLVIGLAPVFSYPKNKNNIWRFRYSNINVGLVHDTSLVLRSGLQGFLGPVHVCGSGRRAGYPEQHYSRTNTVPATARKSETEANDFIHLHPNSLIWALPHGRSFGYIRELILTITLTRQAHLRPMMEHPHTQHPPNSSSSPPSSFAFCSFEPANSLLLQTT